MTNVQIIETEKALNGLQLLEVDTYAGWKARGFQVKRGQHATFSTKIWKPVKDKETGAKKMILVTGHFFTMEQVERV